MAGESDFDIFDASFLGSKIDFYDDNEKLSSAWVLENKVSEDHYQYGRMDALEFQTTSAAWALFECSNADNPPEQAVMRIYYQIPYAGSGLSAKSRAAQATTTNLYGHAVREVDSLRELATSNCSCTPTLIDHKQDVQDEDGPLPGGYRLYTVMTRVPGISLTRPWGQPEAVFWTLSETDRDTVREAFRVAYEELVGCTNFQPYVPNLRNLQWDAGSGKIYIVGFEQCNRHNPPPAFSNWIWIQWGLARVPDEEAFEWGDPNWDDGDTTKWIL